jgi:hypothetical protein
LLEASSVGTSSRQRIFDHMDLLLPAVESMTNFQYELNFLW